MKTSIPPENYPAPSCKPMEKTKDFTIDAETSTRKRIRLFLPLPLLWPILILTLLLFSIAKAQPTDTILLFQEDFNWSENAWNSSKPAESPSANQYFTGKVYHSKRSVKLASSSNEGSISLQMAGIPEGQLLLVIRGARYDKAKESRLKGLLIGQNDTLFIDTLHLSSYYKDGDWIPYQDHDSMTQEPGFASTDTLFWNNTGNAYQNNLSIQLQAQAYDQHFLDHYVLYTIQSTDIPYIEAHPDSVLVTGPTGNWGSALVSLRGQNIQSDIRLQAIGPDRAISAFPIRIPHTELSDGEKNVQIEAKVDSLEKRYSLLCWHGQDSIPIAEIPILVRPNDSSDIPDTAQTECPAPQKLRVDSLSESHARLCWTPGSAMSHVRIGDLFSVIKQIGIQDSILDVKNLESQTWYWWEVASICGTNDTSIYIQGPLFQLPENSSNSKQDRGSLEKATVFPNPSSGKFQLFLPYACQVRILQMNGNCLYEKELTKGWHYLTLNQKGLFILRYGNPSAREQSLKLIIR